MENMAVYADRSGNKNRKLWKQFKVLATTVAFKDTSVADCCKKKAAEKNSDKTSTTTNTNCTNENVNNYTKYCYHCKKNGHFTAPTKKEKQWMNSL